ncbi:MAG: DoxX family protein [Leptolyngbya sp. LCM1.Bin17]|jgi:putative oxidoreductase|nr:MAG: DoxX family protein [Leptolyngbya sp. LCM1.Bin17]
MYTSKDYALLILRLTTVFIFLPHGLAKAFDWSMATGMFSAMGFPGFLGPIIGIVEVIASLLLIVGLFTPWTSLAILAIMAAAITGVHLPASIAAGSATAGLERDVVLVGAALILMAFGPGAVALGRRDAPMVNPASQR